MIIKDNNSTGLITSKGNGNSLITHREEPVQRQQFNIDGPKLEEYKVTERTSHDHQGNVNGVTRTTVAKYSNRHQYGALSQDAMAMQQQALGMMGNAMIQMAETQQAVHDKVEKILEAVGGDVAAAALNQNSLDADWEVVEEKIKDTPLTTDTHIDFNILKDRPDLIEERQMELRSKMMCGENRNIVLIDTDNCVRKMECLVYNTDVAHVNEEYVILKNQLLKWGHKFDKPYKCATLHCDKGTQYEKIFGEEKDTDD